jgi:hypothetical protein
MFFDATKCKRNDDIRIQPDSNTRRATLPSRGTLSIELVSESKEHSPSSGYGRSCKTKGMAGDKCNYRAETTVPVLPYRYDEATISTKGLRPLALCSRPSQTVNACCKCSMFCVMFWATFCKNQQVSPEKRLGLIKQEKKDAVMTVSLSKLLKNGFLFCNMVTARQRKKRLTSFLHTNPRRSHGGSRLENTVPVTPDGTGTGS